MTAVEGTWTCSESPFNGCWSQCRYYPGKSNKFYSEISVMMMSYVKIRQLIKANFIWQFVQNTAAIFAFLLRHFSHICNMIFYFNRDYISLMRSLHSNNFQQTSKQNWGFFHYNVQFQWQLILSIFLHHTIALMKKLDEAAATWQI